MVSSELVHTRRPWLLVLLSGLVCLALDASIFRSGAYSRILSTKSVAGHFAAVARWRLETPLPGKNEVLILGHSKIEAAFSEKMFEEQSGDSNVKIQLASSGGTTEKMWFYLLNHIDPNHNRYAAIVLPIDTYKSPPLETDAENLIDVAQCLAPMLSTRDWIDLIGSYTAPNVRGRVIVGAVMSSHLYALDLQDLILHPKDRREELEWADKAGPTFLHDWDGYEGDLTTLELDREHAKIVYAPPHLDAFRRAEAEARLHALPREHVGTWTQRYHDFRKHWFTRIVDLYANRKTKLIFVQVPRWPFDMPLLLPIAGAPDIRDFLRPSSSVVIVDADAFTDLEKPEYFFDVLHVNKAARRAFTTRFGQTLRDEVGSR